MKTLIIVCVILFLAETAPPNIDCESKPQSEYPFCNSDLDIDTRLDDLVSRFTLEECSSLLNSESPAIPRLGMKAYNWRANCLHGWGFNGGPTDWRDLRWQNFPMPVGLAASFDLGLIREVADVTAHEGRALHNMAREFYNGTVPEAASLNCFSPNINLIRDPRWGRNMEVFSEDPFLTTMMGAAYSHGLQQKVDGYYMLGACPKHFAVHSGPEKTRLSFVATATEHDLYEFFLPQFETQARCLNVLEIMPAYSALYSLESPDGSPDCANKFLLQTLLRKRWNRPDIHVMTDNTAIHFMYSHMKYSKSYQEASEQSINAGSDMDLNQGTNELDRYTTQNVKEGKVKEKTVRDAVRRGMRLRMLVGDFDSSEKVSMQQWGREYINTAENKEVNMRAAHEGIVLLQNDYDYLPLNELCGRIAVIGPNANSTQVMMGDYEAIPDHTYTLLEGIAMHLEANGLQSPLYASGCKDIACSDKSLILDAMHIATAADVIILAVGTDSDMAKEREDMKETTCEGIMIGSTNFPGCQLELTRKMMTLGKKVIIVGMSGQQLNFPVEAHTTLLAPFLGNFGGIAIADVLFGKYNPAGRLPFTIYADTDNLPDISNYDMTTYPGRTYRYHQLRPEYPFGYGLSYTQFKYSNLLLESDTIMPCDILLLSVDVENIGLRDGEEVVQVYITFMNERKELPKQLTPIRTMEAVKRISLKKGETKTVEFELDPLSFHLINEKGSKMIFSGAYKITVGGGQKGFTQVMEETVVISEETLSLEECTDKPYYCPDFSKM